MYHEIHSSAHLPQWVLGPPVEFRAATRTDAYFALRLHRGHIRTGTKDALASLAIANWAPRSGRQENLNCGRNNIWNFLPEFPIKQEPDGAIYNLHTEWDLMFPFGYTPQALFKVFERFMALDDTATILKAVNDDLTFLALSRDRDIRKIRENAVVTCTARDTATTIRSTLAIPPAQSIAEFLLAKNSAMVDAFESAKLIEDLRSRFLSLSISRSWFPRLNEIQKELEGILGRESAEREGTEKSKNQPGVIPVPEEKEMATRPAQGTGNETKNEQNQSKTGGNAPEASGVVPAAKPQLEPEPASVLSARIGKLPQGVMKLEDEVICAEGHPEPFHATGPRPLGQGVGLCKPPEGLRVVRGYENVPGGLLDDLAVVSASLDPLNASMGILGFVECVQWGGSARCPETARKSPAATTRQANVAGSSVPVNGSAGTPQSCQPLRGHLLGLPEAPECRRALAGSVMGPWPSLHLMAWPWGHKLCHGLHGGDPAHDGARGPRPEQPITGQGPSHSGGCGALLSKDWVNAYA